MGYGRDEYTIHTESVQLTTKVFLLPTNSFKMKEEVQQRRLQQELPECLELAQCLVRLVPRWRPQQQVLH